MPDRLWKQVLLRAALCAAVVSAGAARAGAVWAGASPEPVSGVEPDAGEIVPAHPAPSPAALAGAPARSVIGAQDLIDIKVFQLEAFDQTQRVGDDGAITLPLLGRLEVAGLTREETERKIASLLSQWVNDPQVSVFVREHESRRVSVTGAVQKPGSYEMIGARSLVEMIAVAGGTTREAGPTVVVLRRGEGGAEPQRLTLRLDELLRAGDPAATLPIQPGDVIYVPAEEIFRVYVNGAVGRPGPVDVKASEPITILQAVTAAAGTTQRASERRVQVIRKDGQGNKSVLLVDLRRIRQGRSEDIVLMKNDIVFVPESFF